MPTPRALTRILTTLTMCAALTVVTTATASAHATGCTSHTDTDNTTRGTCYNTTTPNDWYYTWQDCSGMLQYGPTKHTPNLNTPTPRCYGNISSAGIQHS